MRQAFRMKRERRNAKDGRSQKLLGWNYRFMEVLQGVRGQIEDPKGRGIYESGSGGAGVEGV